MKGKRGGHEKENKELRGQIIIILTEMQTWMTYVVNLMKEQKMFAPQGGPIILAQVHFSVSSLSALF